MPHAYPILVNVLLVGLMLRSRRRLAWMLPGPLVAMMVALPVSSSRTHALFATMQGIAWFALLYVPVLALWETARPRRAMTTRARILLGGLGISAASIGAWATMVEPFRLEVSHVAVPSVDGTVRIALLADLQTDAAGAAEQRALDAVRASAPDLIVFAGDYVQVQENAAYIEQAAALAGMIRSLDAPLGLWAVRGDVDADHWELVFAGSGAHVITASETFSLTLPGGRPFSLTALTPHDSRAPHPPIPQRVGLHVVFGHAPDYALANPPADILLAGHTHGGQIRVPGFGPLLTMSAVPRAWAAGVTAMPSGATLVVSRGIGMERLDAPRVRLFCRPEVVIIDIGR